MTKELPQKLEWIQDSLAFFMPELLITSGIILILLLGLILKKVSRYEHTDRILYSLAVFILVASSALILSVSKVASYQWKNDPLSPLRIFNNMLLVDSFSSYMKMIIDVAGVLTLFMSFSSGIIKKYHTEYICLLLAIVLGAHLLVMTTNLVVVFLSLEVISISSYVLTGFAFRKEGAEGSLKYFMFGATASAVMLYGFSLLYGITGTLDFSSLVFAGHVSERSTYLFFLAGLFSLAGFFFKIAAVPMHPWAPDVYEAAPMPVVAFFSVAPKLAGLGILARFVLAVGKTELNGFNWQTGLAIVAILTITVGNFSALRQRSPKRMMAYSSIAQSGFLLIGIITFLPQGITFMIFYAFVYLISNFIVFISLQYFEKAGLTAVNDFAGTGKQFLTIQIFLLIGFISLTGLPPAAGFTAKLFIFSGLWEAYQGTRSPVLLLLLVIGLLNTVVSLFYYLRIPFLAFLKTGTANVINNSSSKNLFVLILVLIILLLFFQPNLLMGWINKINFVL